MLSVVILNVVAPKKGKEKETNSAATIIQYKLVTMCLFRLA
jgi:hypothetical protein